MNEFTLYTPLIAVAPRGSNLLQVDKSGADGVLMGESNSVFATLTGANDRWGVQKVTLLLWHRSSRHAAFLNVLPAAFRLQFFSGQDRKLSYGDCPWLFKL